MNEAGFSETIKLVNADGAERMITFRGEKASDWPDVEKAMVECVLNAKEKGWTMPVLRQAPVTQPATPTAAPSNGTTSAAGDNTFHATKLKIEFTPEGKKKGKLFGGKFTQYGVTIWPEVLQQFGHDIDQMSAGEYHFDAVVTYAVNEKNQPQKITGRAA